jgi:RNA ligase
MPTGVNMHLDISEIDQEQFYVSERFIPSIGKVYLITPKQSKHSWNNKELHLRSLLLDANFRVCSSGFGKFFNYGEKPELDALTEQAIQTGNTIFTEKADGSLIIRSVINGQVHFRTRGSHVLADEFAIPVMELVNRRYPRLLDPNLDVRYSLLFEFTSPNNKIILGYQEPELTALGAMDLSASPPEFVSCPEAIQDTYGTPAVAFHKLQGSLFEVIEQVRSWKDSEGIVVWCQLPNGQLHLAKIKTTEYIRLHGLKYHFSAEKCRQFFWYKDISSEQQLQDALFSLGIDWEFAQFILPDLNEYIAHSNKIRQEVSDLIELIKLNGVNALPTRKEKALMIKELTAENTKLFNIGIQYAVGEDIQNHVDALILGVGLNSVKNYRKEAAQLLSDIKQ